ncbi:TetR/AcrR family transcriptional regulator [Cerasicoccus arenae]|uniref:HTH tetR-type domain-containing protein n=1 Tax=Cerasicoccus arenae TaxID=424488 RepID=A0A8J3GEB9_9BACT|nr:TetR/AcrR family transcriptional regulator [Cerasicoccus arenae]MBK1858431.1 TetR family transcriptional regulator [Cerasicoccus arenae]GHC02523.1 hypothetical protein GCM10007047_18870 [Cerasicoccus arenae]
MDPLDTQQRILEAAERFYAERGFEGTSMRNLTEAAGVNLAAVNYHFGSKKALMWEMFRAKIVPLNNARLELLNAALARPEKPQLEDIFDALLQPMFEAAKGPDGANAIFLRMIGRVFSESEEFWQQLHEEFFVDLSRRFLEALASVMPNLPPNELAWRFHLSIATMLGALVTHHSMNRGCVHIDGSDMDATCERLRDFICAGFRGPQGDAN